MSFEAFELEIKRLVAAFSRQFSDLTSPGYSEARLRDDFLNPLLRALGWDLENKAGHIQSKREVEIESRTDMLGKAKRADYLFRIDGTNRFVLEAKKPREILGPKHSFQAKRYAWNMRLPLAVLSDFEEMKVFIVGGKPLPDRPDEGLWKTWHYTQFPSVAREIWDLLARPSVADGSIDKLLDSLPKRPPAGRGKARQPYLIKPDRSRALDADFLAFLDESRRSLGSDLVKNNPESEIRDVGRLTEAVQHILDRLLFLRICEDRDIDTGTRLDSIVETWRRSFHREDTIRYKPGALMLEGQAPDATAARTSDAGRESLWYAIVSHFRALDHRPASHVPFFNGQLFKAHFTDELNVGDQWLADFIGDLSDEESSYLFSVIEVEILGDVYERFLGKVVRPHGRGVTIEEKPEVRKAGGVYYTPRYIVDYIVEQTVGSLLAPILGDKSFAAFGKHTSAIRILDPACGSGSFLIRAFERVCEHWQRRLTAHPEERRKDLCWVDPATHDVHLTVDLKRRILRDNLHGVDIDAQAVEVTQLSLYLKMLEGENRTTLERQRELFSKATALLPPLEDNIKCGNSLIASDFSIDPADLVRSRAFDWPVQFKDIMKRGGFDAVIGNPPWIDIKGFDPGETDYFFASYRSVSNRMNVYAIFMERGFDLLKSGGYLGFITPNSFLTQSSYEKLRRRMLETQIVQIVRTPDNVFAGVSAETAISVYSNSEPNRPVEVLVFPAQARLKRIGKEDGAMACLIDQKAWMERPDCLFNLHMDLKVNPLLDKISGSGSPLADLCHFCLGLTPYDKAKGHTPAQIKGRVFHSSGQAGENWKPLLTGGDIQRFSVNCGGKEYIHYGPWLGAPREKRFFTEPRILVRQIVSGNPPRIYAGYTNQELYNTQIAFNLLARDTTVESLKYILGILNSSLMTWYHRARFLDATKTVFQKILIQDAKNFPIRRIDFANARDRSLHDQLGSLVDKLLTLVPRNNQAITENEKAILQNAVTATDQQIDQLVYELYGLTPEEIDLVEGEA